MLEVTAGIAVLFAGSALLALSVLAFRASRRAQAYTPTPAYSRSVDPAVLDRGGYTTHGMVDGERNTLIPQRKKADSYYESFL